jgi:hypothetical protein
MRSVKKFGRLWALLIIVCVAALGWVSFAGGGRAARKGSRSARIAVGAPQLAGAAKARGTYARQAAAARAELEKERQEGPR